MGGSFSVEMMWAVIENIVLYTHMSREGEQHRVQRQSASLIDSDFPLQTFFPSIPDNVGGVRGPSDASDDFNSREGCK